VRRARLTLGYDGADFVGSQIQGSGRTVQRELELAIQRLAPGSGRTSFAGRTDRGVHAVGQVVSLDVSWSDSAERLRDALNVVLPPDMSVGAVEWTSPTFHARYDATWREYRYRIWVAPTPPPLGRRYVWWRRSELDGAVASDACSTLLGRHAFGTFAGSGRSRSHDAAALTRTVRTCEWRVQTSGAVVRHELRIEADGFLPQMVRTIVATIVLVAQGKRDVQWFREALRANDRSVPGEPAPPEGLFLWCVRYDDERDDSGDGFRSDWEYGIER
jgi:tRNA pseudouridine38-40 synthase